MKMMVNVLTKMMSYMILSAQFVIMVVKYCGMLSIFKCFFNHDFLRETYIRSIHCLGSSKCHSIIKVTLILGLILCCAFTLFSAGFNCDFISVVKEDACDPSMQL